MNMHEFLKALPKVSLHVHLMGSVQARTAVDLCNKHGVPLPDYRGAGGPLRLPGHLQVPAHVRQHRARRPRPRGLPPHRVRDADRGRREQRPLPRDVLQPDDPHGRRRHYETCVDGLIDGIRDARTDHGIDCKLIAAVNRMETPELAVTMVETLAEHPRDDVIGIGMDYAEAEFPPERFWKAYRMADDLGLHLTAHRARTRHPEHRDLPRPAGLRASRPRLPRDRERRDLQPLSG